MAIDLISVLKKNRVVPVAVFDDITDSLRTAELLLENSINILEIALRTEIAYECIEMVKDKYPEITIGAGSVLSLESLKTAFKAGAFFCVAPGTDMELVDYSILNDLAFIPGVSTPTELNSALQQCSIIKIFPISLLGGISYIKAVTAPLMMKDFYIIPTGGVNEKNYNEYLKQDKVISCGMSYIVDSKLIRKGDFNTIKERIKRISNR